MKFDPDYVYAWMAEGEGNGIVTMTTQGQHMPLVCCSLGMALRMGYALATSSTFKETGNRPKIRLVQYKASKVIFKDIDTGAVKNMAQGIEDAKS